MVRKGRAVKDRRKRILRTAEEIATQKLMDEANEELGRVGAVWAGILDLEDAIPATTVAAMLACHELVVAAANDDPEENWTMAAAYSALGAYTSVPAEIQEELEEEIQEVKMATKIGFSPEEEEDSE